MRSRASTRFASHSVSFFLLLHWSCPRGTYKEVSLAESMTLHTTLGPPYAVNARLLERASLSRTLLIDCGRFATAETLSAPGHERTRIIRADSPQDLHCLLEQLLEQGIEGAHLVLIACDRVLRASGPEAAADLWHALTLLSGRNEVRIGMRRGTFLQRSPPTHEGESAMARGQAIAQGC